MLSRRQALHRMAFAGAGAVLSTETADAIAGEQHWLDSRSSQEIEEVLRETGAWTEFRRRMSRRAKQAATRRRRETRADNTVIYRGPLTGPLPESHSRGRIVQASRREMIRSTVGPPGETWQGYDLAHGTVVLVDARLRDGTAALAEIIDTPRGRRVHVWPAPIESLAGGAP